MAANLSTQSAAVRAMIESIARQVARDEIATALRNQRPGGLVPVACTIVAPVASLTVPAAHIDIPFPGFLHKITLRTDVLGSATVDIWKRRPALPTPSTFHDASSILGSTFPTLAGRTDVEMDAQPDWTTWIEADSTLYFFVTTVADIPTSLTINVWIRATAGVA